MDRQQPFDNTPAPLDPAQDETVRRREQELEAQIAELKQDKDRLLGLLDLALTALNRHTEHSHEEHSREGLPPSSAHIPTRTATHPPQKKLQPGTWAWLKDWFLNA